MMKMSRTMKNRLKFLSVVFLMGGLLGGYTITNSSTIMAKAKTVKIKKKAKPIKKKTVAGSKNMAIDFVMKPRNQSQLRKDIYATVTPGNKKYRKYLSPTSFGKSYGASTKSIKLVTSFLKKNHLKVSIYKGNVILRVSGKTRDFNKALKIQMVYAKAGSDTFTTSSKTPTLPKNLKSVVLDIVGLSSAPLTESTKQTKQPITPKPSAPVVQSKPVDYSHHKFVDTYNVGDLYKSGHKGQKQTIGIITFSKFNQQDILDFWKLKTEKVPASASRLSVKKIENGGNWDGYSETTMDIEAAGAIAPSSKLKVYQTDNTDLGQLNAYAQAVSDNQTAQLSNSWGKSESQTTFEEKNHLSSAHYVQAMDLVAEQAAIQGISNFSAAGDNGAYDDMLFGGTEKDVDFPSGLVYMTAIGGTTLPLTDNNDNQVVTKQRAWSWDYQYPIMNDYFAKSPKSLTSESWMNSYMVGSGGGFSKLSYTPAYQKSIKGVNTYNGVSMWRNKSKGARLLAYNDALTPSQGKVDSRNVPDLAVNADPMTGYNALMSDPNSYRKHQQSGIVGGTSVAAPQVAAMSAVMNSGMKHRIGFWNPQIYRLAKHHDSPFTPMNDTKDNNNLFYTGQPGTIYNQATGLGYPDFTKLFKDLNK
ncbi:S53 family peptidase [Pediococcus argentinicus]|uniref:S53 family peptidase n=1 Tax=Pediococcus argentinicus TaxID=480391 RepID=UPI00338DAB20